MNAFNLHSIDRLHKTKILVEHKLSPVLSGSKTQTVHKKWNKKKNEKNADIDLWSRFEMLKKESSDCNGYAKYREALFQVAKLDEDLKLLRCLDPAKKRKQSIVQGLFFNSDKRNSVLGSNHVESVEYPLERSGAKGDENSKSNRNSLTSLFKTMKRRSVVPEPHEQEAKSNNVSNIGTIVELSPLEREGNINYEKRKKSFSEVLLKSKNETSKVDLKKIGNELIDSNGITIMEKSPLEDREPFFQQEKRKKSISEVLFKMRNDNNSKQIFSESSPISINTEFLRKSFADSGKKEERQDQKMIQKNQFST
jgi:hypothetical protein